MTLLLLWKMLGSNWVTILTVADSTSSPLFIEDRHLPHGDLLSTIRQRSTAASAARESLGICCAFCDPRIRQQHLGRRVYLLGQTALIC